MMQSLQTRRLPYVEHPTLLPQPMPAEPPGTIMVIDDSMTVRAVIEACLRRYGFQVTAFADGLAAMGALSRGEVAGPHLRLLDIGPPEMEGDEVAALLRGRPGVARARVGPLSPHAPRGPRIPG